VRAYMLRSFLLRFIIAIFYSLKFLEDFVVGSSIVLIRVVVPEWT
jgi:hypothetical protein